MNGVNTTNYLSGIAFGKSIAAEGLYLNKEHFDTLHTLNSGIS